MSNLLICMGKKKAVRKVVELFEGMSRLKQVDIIATSQTGKKVMIWNYEELKILFEQKKRTTSIQIDRGLINSLDFITIRAAGPVLLKISTFKLENPELKWNILSLTNTFQLRGGKLDIDEVAESRNNREYRLCHITLMGPVASVVGIKDVLLKENMADPKTVNFVL